MPNLYKLFGLFGYYRKIFISIRLINYMDSYTKIQEYLQSLLRKTIEENKDKTIVEIMIDDYIIDIPRPVKKRDKIRLERLIE